MRQIKKLMAFLLALLLLAGSTSCSPEKAKALQTAATSFASESETAITTLQQLFSEDVGANVESDQEEIEETLRTLQGEKSVSASTLSELLTGSRFNVPALEKSNKEFNALQAQYAQFAAMYVSLDRGYLFAGKSVKESEVVSIKLTVQMINFASMVSETPFQFRSRRVLLIEKINRAYALKDEAGRAEALKTAAQAVVQLRKDEASANESAIKQCLKAAQAGRVATGLVRDFDRLSIGDMLGAVNDSLSFISGISKDPNVANLLKQYKSIEATIQADPYWAPILSQTILPEKTDATK